MGTSVIEFAGRRIGAGEPCFIIAEAGCNHDGSIEKARALIDLAVEARADAVKFQTFDADRLAMKTSPKAAYQLQTTDAEESQYAMLRKLQLPPECFRELSDYAHTRGILFLSTPFDEESAAVLAALDVPAFKTGSGELTHLPLLATIAAYGKPMLVSTGMGTLGEIEAALRAIRGAGNDRIALFHAVSCYPAEPPDVNLRALDTMAAAFGIPIGYSDHTIGISVALAAVARGAALIEKHFTLDREAYGPDHRASLSPQQLHDLVREIRVVEAALGDGRKEPRPAELDTRTIARRSIVAVADIAAGAVIDDAQIAVLRPGTGLPPQEYANVRGQRARTAIPQGTLISWDMIA